MGADAEKFSSNSSAYSQRLVTQEQLRATQEELATKIRELQIYESNYITLKKDLARWKKKFEYIFRENELLSLETAKLDASHKQIAFLQQEIKFKEEEATALRGLVSALEASNKKARASRLDSVARQTSFRSASISAAPVHEHAAGASSNEELERERAERQEEKERHLAEISALKAENGMLLKDLDRKDMDLQLRDDKVDAHKERISTLETTLQEEQDTNLARMREKQDLIADLELQVRQLEMRRRSSAAMLAKVEEEVGFGVLQRINSNNLDKTDEEGEEDIEPPDTPPGTPPPISAGGLLPPEDPNADQIVRDWTQDRKVRAAPSVESIMDQERVQDFLEKLPYDSREGAQRILMDIMDSENGHQIDESQILLRNVNTERQKEIQEFIVPLLKAYHNIRVAYSTMQRRTLATDVRIMVERRRDSVTGGVVPGEKRFGKDHSFYGPSADDVGKLVPHTDRVMSTGNKAIYVSKPKHADKPANAPETPQHPGGSPVDTEQSSTIDSPGGETASDTGMSVTAAPAGPVVNRKWRGISAAKFIGTMAAGAKQRVAARFANSKHVHEGTSCQFCKVSPIVGQRYSCMTCVGFDLCETCYSLGGHGLENSDELFYRVQELVLARCPRLGQEMDLLELMRFEICRANLRKFSFCLNWLADIINGKSSRELQARALEIPSIRRDVRKQFVPLLLTVCSDREDIEVKTEWELESDNSAEVRSVVRGSLSEGDGRFLETLRIWVADQYRTTSPFVERTLMAYNEGEEGEEEEEEEVHEAGSDFADDDHVSSSRDPHGSAAASSQPGFLERNRIQKEEF